MRIGIGYDVHAFVERRPLVLGGVHIPHERGLAGHSDADVLVHAVMDALLGAVRQADIGQHFPDSDPSFKDVSSLELLRHTAGIVADAGYIVVDVDCVVALELPKVAPYRERMRQAIARELGVSTDNVGVKATTTEGLGFTGREEGVAAWAVALLDRCPE
jgi:2-C-methyl-D-erythritol 2,4-cyclodiphosphate synthase